MAFIFEPSNRSGAKAGGDRIIEVDGELADGCINPFSERRYRCDVLECCEFGVGDVIDVDLDEWTP